MISANLEVIWAMSVEEAREAMAREEAEAENRIADSSPEPLRGR